MAVLVLRPNAIGDGSDQPLASSPNVYPNNWQNVDSCTTITRVTLTLVVRRT